MNGSGSELDGTLAQGTHITGTLRFERAVRIDGKFEGKVESPGKLVLGPSARVDAEIEVGELEVQGNLRGEVKAAQRMMIRDGGQVEANIVTARLAIETGAIFRGHCEMPDAEKAKPTPAPKKPGEGAEPAKSPAGEAPKPEPTKLL